MCRSGYLDSECQTYIKMTARISRNFLATQNIATLRGNFAKGRRNGQKSAVCTPLRWLAASQMGCFATRYSEIVRSEVPSEVGSMGGAVVGSEGGAGLAGEASRTAAATSETLVGDSGGAASEGEHSGGRPPDLSSGGRALCHACTMHRHPKCPLASALCIRKRSDRVDRY